MWIAVALALAVPIAVVGFDSGSARAFPTPIQHVVVILQENHAFDNLFAHMCIEDNRGCDATLTGHRLDGSAVPLSAGTDMVPPVDHKQIDQVNAMNGGAMNGFEKIQGCETDQCYTAYEPTQIPTLAALARSGAISDQFYSRDIVPSWGGHIDFFAQTLDGFRGENPVKHDKTQTFGPGWGCDSKKDTPWMDPVTHKWVWEPACIPAQDGSGPYRPSPAQYVPTIADRIEAAGHTWAIYGNVTANNNNVSAYRWSICPSFAECFYGPQKKNLHTSTQMLSDAAKGTLPNFSIILPNGVQGQTSQHNGNSMILGDNWIGQTVSAIQNGPDGPSTTIFVYYDDCGCFFDHAPPPAGLGIRLPIVMISPYAKVGYTDHTVSTNSSILAYAEHALAIDPINTLDGSAYDLSNNFDYTQTPTPPFQFHPTKVPASSIAYLKKHPPADDDT